MAHAKIEAFMRTAVGRGMNPDRAYDYQCKDLADQYGMEIFGTKLFVAIGAGDAKFVLARANTKYWTVIKDDFGNANQIPQRGDLIVWGGNANNPSGHVALVEKADQYGVDVFQQDGFNRFTPTHRARLGYDNKYTGRVIGWLRPKLTVTAKVAAVVKPKKTYVQLPKTATRWGIYRKGVAPVTRNIFAYLRPKKFGGIEYQVQKWMDKNKTVALIKTRDYGLVQIYVGKETKARIVKK
ncbi:CHAP domain-containing protein [Arthrobacter sulfonylureivorans]|uniref:CHAP domain-containing protein n=1 Tax=Arthrobacter sulfonylureivorans TaxID=2486855 RepID=UPI0039E41BA3